MRELLQQALDALNWICEHPEEPSIKVLDAIESIEAALSRSEWVSVAERLPVVPSHKGVVDIWIWRKDKVARKSIWRYDYGLIHADYFTHWMYRQDDTPAPPRSES